MIINKSRTSLLTIFWRAGLLVVRCKVFDAVDVSQAAPAETCKADFKRSDSPIWLLRPITQRRCQIAVERCESLGWLALTIYFVAKRQDAPKSASNTCWRVLLFGFADRVLKRLLIPV